MFLIIFIGLIGLLCAFSTYFRYNRAGRLLAKIPGPPGLYIFHNIFDVILDQEKLFAFARTLVKYGRIVAIKAFHHKCVNVYEPDDYETILSNPKLIEKSLPYKFLRPWLGKGLLINNGESWHHRRKLLTPAFHFNILKKFCRVFTEQATELVELIGREHVGRDTELMPLVAQHTVRVMCETSMGIGMFKSIKLVAKKYLNAITVVGECIMYRLIHIWLYNDYTFQLTKTCKIQKAALADVHKFTRKIIRERKELRKNNDIETENSIEDEVYGNKRRLVMLDVLLDQEALGNIDFEGIREEVDTFLFEGHDTTAAALSFMIMRIANEPEAQRKIYEELLNVFGQSERDPTTEDLAALKYLECCIKESLRLYPSVPFISRDIIEDIHLGGYTVPAGTICNLHIFDLHRRAALFPQPERFVPERFLPESCAGRHPYAYLPFSAGPRNCIGQKFAMLEMKTVMSGLLRKYSLEPVTRPEDIVFKSDLVLRSRDPLYVRFSRRNDRYPINL